MWTLLRHSTVQVGLNISGQDSSIYGKKWQNVVVSYAVSASCENNLVLKKLHFMLNNFTWHTEVLTAKVSAVL